MRIFTYFAFLILFLLPNLTFAERADVSSMFLPFTSRADLIKCEDYLDYDKEFEQALDCSVEGCDDLREKFESGEVEKPECYVIPASSPDVVNGNIFNFVMFSSIYVQQIVGFYDPESKIMYAVENEDTARVVRHELQHYFIDIALGEEYGYGDGLHIHEVWFTCEEPYYTIGKEALKKAKRDLELEV
jgi:hypothetical protein